MTKACGINSMHSSCDEVPFCFGDSARTR